MKRCPVNEKVRVELYCGIDEPGHCTIDEAIERYGKAIEIASGFGIETYFDDFEEHGTRHMDGYIYPCFDNVIAVLDQLDASGVEYDNIDLPDDFPKSLLKVLKERFARLGVSINEGEYP